MPRQSSLIQYENEIVALRRRKPPTPYSQIAEYLRENYQIVVNRESIFKFIKNRAKGIKPCKYAWVIEPADTNDQRSIETPSLQKTAVMQTQKPSAPENPTPPVESKPVDIFEMPFSPDISRERYRRNP